MKKQTNEFSFILKPSNHGVGVFAVHDIAKGTYLRLFGNEKLFENRIRILKTNDIPAPFHDYCMNRGDELVCPEDFGQMPVGWYLNHSKNPNAHHQNYNWYAFRDIMAGEEILIDYNSLEEPAEAKVNYYKYCLTLECKLVPYIKTACMAVFVYVKFLTTILLFRRKF